MAAVIPNGASHPVSHPSAAKEFNTRSILETSERLRSAGQNDIPTELTVSETERTVMRHDEWRDLAEIPVIDLSQLQTDRAGVVRQIGEAVTDWGFFQLVNHDLRPDVMRRIQAEGLKFFELPSEVKERIGSAEAELGGLTPYVGNNTKHNFSSLHWAESLLFTREFLDQIVTKVWPEGNEEFRNAIVDLSSGADKVAFGLLELIAESLTLPTDFFAKHFTANSPGLRWNFYPACPRPKDSIGATPHTDFVVLTLLLQDKTGGLQIKKGDQWIGIRPIEGALVVNVGDLLHAWTNGICKSLVHRVLVNKEVHRLSFACFFSVDNQHPIAAPEELLDDSNPRRYKTLTPLEYITKTIQCRNVDKTTTKDGVAFLEEKFKFEK